MDARKATIDDVDALVRLRAQMFADMHRPPGEVDAPWRMAAAAWFTERLATGDFAAFVVDDPELGVVASAAADCRRVVPGPGDVANRRAELFNVSTDPRCRRRGYARACVTALLDWLDVDAGVVVTQLQATEYGIELYRSLGFEPPRYPALRRRRAMLEP